MRLPRDLSGEELAKLLQSIGYRVTRQTGSHLRLTTELKGEHSITIPRHKALKIGTLSGIINDVAEHVGKTKEQILKDLFKQP